MTLQTWIIEPRDSLIVRDGKPFGVNITHATSLDFPFPSTTTGGVRTRAGLDANGKFDVSQISVVKDIEVKGSLLAEIHLNFNTITDFYLPSPADALLLQDDKQRLDKTHAQLYRLLPLDIADSLNNLEGLLPVGLNRTDKKDKPFNDLAFWSWRQLLRWLKDSYDSTSIELKEYGIGSLKKDSRTHVAINLDMASSDGDLFSTRGLEFNYSDPKKAIDLEKVKKLALVVFVDDANSKKLENKGNLAPLGGERRLVTWREDKNQQQIQTCPDEIKKRIKAEKHCRLMLLTPAFFTEGMPKSNADYEVKAIACNRYQTVSGWDFEIDRPKPTRRLLPAGSVLFLDLQNNKDIESWIDNTWFSCVGDNEQAIKDGFGLSVLGTWDGETKKVWE
jgi:CRISPR-associated protein Cmr3